MNKIEKCLQRMQGEFELSRSLMYFKGFAATKTQRTVEKELEISIQALQEKIARDKMRCENCIWWINKKIMQPDGTLRDYTAEEELFVTADVGINIGAHCMKHGLWDESGSWFWANANDFCSRFKQKESEGKANE